MKILCVTHGDVDNDASRVLSELGREQVREAARYGRTILGESATVVSIVSSPRLRCVETGLLVVAELARTTLRDNRGQRKGGLWDDVPTTRVHICPELDEVPGQAMRPGGLAAAIHRGAEDVAQAEASELARRRGEAFEPVVVLAAHGDLANAINFRHAEHVKDGFFVQRAAVALIDDIAGNEHLKHCAVRSGGWIRIDAHRPD